MTPYYADDWLTVYLGDCREVMAAMEPESVHCVVTSPPYWGLRDYGIGDKGLGLEPTPEAYVEAMVAVFREVRRVLRPDGTVWLNLGDSYASGPVGVQRVRDDRRQAGSSEGDVQAVLPPLRPDALDGRAPGAVARDLEGVASGARRGAERTDASSPAGTPSSGDGDAGGRVQVLRGDDADLPDAGPRSERRLQGPEAGAALADGEGGSGVLSAGPLSDPLLELQRREVVGRVSPLAAKQLVGIPWRVAFALQADGWYLRSDIIWSKPNPMPESVTDRPTKAHEYVFLLSKSPRYYYDADAVREPADYAGAGMMNVGARRKLPVGELGGQSGLSYAVARDPSAGRNLRSVWNIATEPYPGAHFATFPRALVEPCIKAGTSEKGVCPECGAPWVREVGMGQVLSTGGSSKGQRVAHLSETARLETRTDNSYNTGDFVAREHVTTGWRPTCRHGGIDDGSGDASSPETAYARSGLSVDGATTPRRQYTPVPATVLDPFAGSGTTGLVAQSLSRRAVLVDLSADYLEQLMDRNRDIPLGLAGG